MEVLSRTVSGTLFAKRSHQLEKRESSVRCCSFCKMGLRCCVLCWPCGGKGFEVCLWTGSSKIHIAFHNLAARPVLRKTARKEKGKSELESAIANYEASAEVRPECMHVKSNLLFQNILAVLNHILPFPLRFIHCCEISSSSSSERASFQSNS